MTPIKWLPRPAEVPLLDTDELRAAFAVTDLFASGEQRVQFTDLDRLVLGGISPAPKLELANYRETGTDFFLERRELGAINLGAAGRVTVDGQAFEVAPLGCIYVGMGSRSVLFESLASDQPARFYILSCPAHRSFPVAVATPADANQVKLGDAAHANERTIYQYVHQDGIPSCQLVMGYTVLAPGSVWNTFPPHTHTRRTEIYLYFDLAPTEVVVHLMGEPTATRHLFLHNEQAALSPAWSIHAGCGTAAYKFIWGMAGENQTFTDMDGVPGKDLR